jgi:hypothetical protein
MLYTGAKATSTDKEAVLSRAHKYMLLRLSLLAH